MSQSSKRALPAPGFAEDPPAGYAPQPPLTRHLDWLQAALRRRFGPDAAEDLAQEAYLRAASRPPGPDVRSPRAWLLTVALNAARDSLRRRAARPPLTEADGARQLADQHATGADQEQALLLKQVILSLPSHLQEVFLLSRFGGLTYEEIARRCGISVKTVEWRMSKALAICAAQLRD